MPARIITPLYAVAFAIMLGTPANRAEAQSTYVGTFAITNARTIKCPTVDSTIESGVLGNPWAATLGQQWAFFRLPSGFYAIMNIKSTLFLNDKGTGFNSAIQSPWDASLGQQWYLYPFGDNFYALVSARSSMMLSDYENVNQSGLVLGMHNWANTLNQRWHLYFLRF